MGQEGLTFWQACKPYFSNESSHIQGNIMLVDKGKLLSNQKGIALTFSKYLGSIICTLNRFSWPEDTPMPAGNEKLNSIIKKLAFHASKKRSKEEI